MPQLSQSICNPTVIASCFRLVALCLCLSTDLLKIHIQFDGNLVAIHIMVLYYNI